MERFEPEDTVMSLPASDITIRQGLGDDLTTKYEYPLKRPSEYENDFFIQVKASDIRKVHSKIDEVNNNIFPIHELLLGIASITAGASLSALISKVLLDSCLGIIMYIVCPMIAVGTIVAYFFTRHISNLTAKEFARSIKDYLVDPDNVE